MMSTPICSIVDDNGGIYYSQDRQNRHIAVHHNFGLHCPSSGIRNVIKGSQVALRDKAGNNQPRMRISWSDFRFRKSVNRKSYCSLTNFIYIITMTQYGGYLVKGFLVSSIIGESMDYVLFIHLRLCFCYFCTGMQIYEIWSVRTNVVSRLTRIRNKNIDGHSVNGQKSEIQITNHNKF